jgi:hypothetical protein
LISKYLGQSYIVFIPPFITAWFIDISNHLADIFGGIQETMKS